MKLAIFFDETVVDIHLQFTYWAYSLALKMEVHSAFLQIVSNLLPQCMVSAVS
jgi:hypothetical protein